MPSHPSPLVRAALAACVSLGLSLGFSPLARAADEAAKGDPADGSGVINAAGEWEPKLKPASDAAERALERIKAPAGLSVSVWAAEPMLGNPNALGIDEHGKVYVAETYRYRRGVIDVRKAMNWLEEDVAAKTVEDRVAMVKRHASEAPGKEALTSPDTDRIVLLQDTNSDGKADKSTVFATNFNKVEDGLGSGVFPYKGNVFYTCIPSLYRLKDTNGDGKADERTALQTGFGVRYAYLGHDLHGMVMGPDGKLYFSIGDRGANVTKTPDGKTVEATETGSVFRCDLDGTNLEVYATGLRNPQELRFDNYGNLFTGDNNPDKGDPARWVYVTEDSDTGWRIGYQHAEQMASGGPWIAEQLWAPDGNSNAAYITPGLTTLGAGPSGLAFYPGTGMGDRLQDTFLLCDFRGAAGTSLIHGIKMKSKGASFEVAEVKPFLERIAATDCDFGPDGALYVADWVDGWPRPMQGRVYKVADPKAADDPVVKEVQRLIAEGFAQRSPDELAKLLAHRDLRVRQEAQFALADKGAASSAILTSAAQKGENLLARLHGIWGLGQVARKSPEAVAAIVPLLGDKELEVRCQAARVLGDASAEAAYDGLVKMLQDPEPRARFFAAQALGKLGKKAAVPALFATLKANDDQDAFVRHACVAALAKLKDFKALSAAATDESRAVRLGAVLALRKLESGRISAFLEDKDPQVVLEAARAINDLPIIQALPALAALTDKPLPAGANKAAKPASTKGPKPTGAPADWVLWRAVNANFRLGTPEAAAALAKFAARSDAPDAVRVEALDDLAAWAKPSNLDRVTNLYRPLEPRDPKVAREAVRPVLDGIQKTAPEKVKVAAANLARKLGLGDPAALVATVGDVKAPADVRVAALDSLADMKDAKLADAVAIALKDKSDAVRGEAIRLLATLPNGTGQLVGLLGTGNVKDKQAALAALGATEGAAEADKTLAAWMDDLLKGKVAPELQLDLLEAAAKRKDPAVAERVKQFESARAAADPLGPYRETLAGGTPALGHKVFRERADVSCIRCHMAGGEGGIVGPALDGIGAKQSREYLLEAIVAPNAKIAPGYESVIVKTKDNKFKVGVVKRDDDKELVLLNPDAQVGQDPQIVIPKDQIVSRERGPSAMPEGIHKTLTKQDLRNLVEWLASLKQEPKPAAAAQ